MPDNKKKSVDVIAKELQDAVNPHMTNYSKATLAILAEEPAGLCLEGDSGEAKLIKMKEAYSATAEAINGLKGQILHLNPDKTEGYLRRLNRHYAQLLLRGYVQAADAALSRVVADTAANPVALDKYVLKDREKEIQRIFKRYELAIYDAFFVSRWPHEDLKTWVGTDHGTFVLDHYLDALTALKVFARRGLLFEKVNQDLQRLLTRFDPTLSYDAKRAGLNRGSCMPQSVLKSARKDIRRLMHSLARAAHKLNLSVGGLGDDQPNLSALLSYPFSVNAQSKMGIVTQAISQKHLEQWRDQGPSVFGNDFANSMDRLAKKKAPRKHWIWVVSKNLIITCLNSDKSLLKKINKKKPHDFDDNFLFQNMSDNNNANLPLVVVPSGSNSIKHDDNSQHADNEKNKRSSINEDLHIYAEEIPINDINNGSSEQKNNPTLVTNAYFTNTYENNDSDNNIETNETINNSFSVSVIEEDGTEKRLEPIPQSPSYQRDYAEWLRNNPNATLNDFDAYAIQHINAGCLQVREEQIAIEQGVSKLEKEGTELYKTVQTMKVDQNKIQDGVNDLNSRMDDFSSKMNDVNSKANEVYDGMKELREQLNKLASQGEKKLEPPPSPSTQPYPLQKTNSTDSPNAPIIISLFRSNSIEGCLNANKKLLNTIGSQPFEQSIIIQPIVDHADNSDWQLVPSPHNNVGQYFPQSPDGDLSINSKEVKGQIEICEDESESQFSQNNQYNNQQSSISIQDEEGNELEKIVKPQPSPQALSRKTPDYELDVQSWLNCHPNYTEDELYHYMMERLTHIHGPFIQWGQETIKYCRDTLKELSKQFENDKKDMSEYMRKQKEDVSEYLRKQKEDVSEYLRKQTEDNKKEMREHMQKQKEEDAKWLDGLSEKINEKIKITVESFLGPQSDQNPMWATTPVETMANELESQQSQNSSQGISNPSILISIDGSENKLETISELVPPSHAFNSESKTPSYKLMGWLNHNSNQTTQERSHIHKKQKELKMRSTRSCSDLTAFSSVFRPHTLSEKKSTDSPNSPVFNNTRPRSNSVI